MIELHVEPYCQNCSDFEADVVKDNLYGDGLILVSKTVIFCKHRSRCAQLVTYIQNERMNSDE